MSEKTYAVVISRFDEDGNQTEIVDQYISADDAIDLMIHINENVPDASAEEEEDDDEADEEEEQEEETPAPRAGKKPRLCGKCGKPGHTVRTCQSTASVDIGGSEQSEDEEEDDDDMGGEDPHVARMVKMLRAGKSEHEIYVALHDYLTDAQYREKLEQAKELV
jgi:cobalamin biosynthesis protein CobT